MSNPRIRRIKVSGLTDKKGKPQKGRAKIFDGAHDKDDIERQQDYGFSSNPGEGEGLALEIGGHIIMMRVTRSGEAKELDVYEVSMWHKEGHHVTLRNGSILEFEAANMNFKGNANFTDGTLKHNGVNVGADHTHGGVESGGNSTDTPNS